MNNENGQKATRPGLTQPKERSFSVIKEEKERRIKIYQKKVENGEILFEE